MNFDEDNPECAGECLRLTRDRTRQLCSACVSSIPDLQPHISTVPPFLNPLFPPLTHTKAHAGLLKHTLNAAGRLSQCCRMYLRLHNTERNNTNLHVWNRLLCSPPNIASLPAVKVHVRWIVFVCGMRQCILKMPSHLGVKLHVECLIYCSKFLWKHKYFDIVRSVLQCGPTEINKQVKTLRWCGLQGSKVWWRPTKIVSLRSNCTGRLTLPQSSRKWPPPPLRRCTPKRPWWVRKWKKNTLLYCCRDFWCLFWQTDVKKDKKQCRKTKGEMSQEGKDEQKTITLKETSPKLETF